MKLSFSVAAQDRRFAKAYRRVRPQLDPLCDEFEAVGMTDPIHEAILIGVTDSKPPNYFEIVPNRDGFFQVLAGVSYEGSDEDLTKQILSRVSEAVAACPFSKPDKGKFNALVDQWM